MMNLMSELFGKSDELYNHRLYIYIILWYIISLNKKSPQIIGIYDAIPALKLVHPFQHCTSGGSQVHCDACAEDQKIRLPEVRRANGFFFFRLDGWHG